MALTNNDIRLLFYMKKKGVSFDTTLMLGRLKYYGTSEYIKNLISKANSNVSLPEIIDGYSEPVFKMLGSHQVDSMDFSDYEKANIIHDLNYPIPDSLKQKYSFVIDSGTLEHVFNFPVAISNCMKLVKTGGHFAAITPVNNLMGHGFYQFSPELFYRIFSEENGFRMCKMLITATNSAGEFSDWYEVSDPKTVKNRVIMVNHLPTYLMYYAEKIAEVEHFKMMPQQSDYVDAWTATDTKSNTSVSLKSRILKFLIPEKMRDVIYAVRTTLNSGHYKTKDLGALNDKHFKKFDDSEI